MERDEATIAAIEVSDHAIGPHQLYDVVRQWRIPQRLGQLQVFVGVDPAKLGAVLGKVILPTLRRCKADLADAGWLAPRCDRYRLLLLLLLLLRNLGRIGIARVADYTRIALRERVEERSKNGEQDAADGEVGFLLHE